MQFTTATVTAVLTFATSTAAGPVQARQDALKDWEIFSVHSGSPSGRPGSYPWSSITANVTDPNEINLGTAESDGSAVIVPAGSQGINCVAKYFKNESPLGRTWPCDSTENGYWTMQVLAGSEGNFATSNFNLKFAHVADVLYRGSQYKASFEAEGSFALGENLKGTCGGSGVCSWGLAAEKIPFKVQPKKL